MCFVDEKTYRALLKTLALSVHKRMCVRTYIHRYALNKSQTS
jgi:hypothetical protein